MTTASAAAPHRYQRFDGTLSKGRWTWLAIVVSGIRLAAKGRKTRTLLMTTWLIVLGGCIVLYLLSLLETLAGNPEAQGIIDFARGFLRLDLSAVSQIESLREVLWNTQFLVMIRIEMFWVLLIVARVGPGLIAGDLKHGALPIYFAKPITPLTYLAGKWVIVAAFIAMATLGPNLVTLAVSTLITGGLHTWGQTLALGVDLILSGAIVCVVGGAIVLALSSLTSDARYVTVAWLAVCLLPLFGQTIMDNTLSVESTTGWLGCISLWDNVRTVSDSLLGLRTALETSGLPTEAFTDALVKPVRPFCAIVVLAAWTVGGLLVSYWRVITFSRSAANV